MTRVNVRWKFDRQFTNRKASADMSLDVKQSLLLFDEKGFSDSSFQAIRVVSWCWTPMVMEGEIFLLEVCDDCLLNTDERRVQKPLQDCKNKNEHFTEDEYAEIKYVRPLQD